MKVSLFVLFLCGALVSSASEYMIYSDGTFKGLKNCDGEILIPAIYDDLGWSDGTEVVIDEIIGFEMDGRWGLVSTSNKILTKAGYHKILPFGKNRYLVSTLGKFSNRYFKGLIDSKGRILLDFEYFELEPTDFGGVIVTDIQGGRTVKGVLGAAFNSIIPIEYDRIIHAGALVIAVKGADVVLFNQSGEQLLSGLDAYEFRKDLLVVMQNGRYGAFDYSGGKLSDVVAKDIISVDEIRRFPKWEVVNGTFSLGVEADSLSYFSDDVWIAHNNHATSVVSPDEEIQTGYFQVKQVLNGFAVIRSNKEKWSVITTEGSRVLQAFDSIYFNSRYFYGLQGGYWSIYDQNGTKLTEQEFDAFTGKVTGDLVGLKRYNYWALFNTSSGASTSFIFDEVLPVNNQYAISKYVGVWGVTDTDNNWLVPPKYRSIVVKDQLYIGVKKNINEFYRAGVLVNKVPGQVLSGDLLQVKENGLYRLYNSYGKPVNDSFYDTIKQFAGYLSFTDSAGTVLRSITGRDVLTRRDRVQRVYGFAEDYFLIKKFDAFGFVDTNGLLRIANRYDSAQVFSEGLAPVLIREKWGFIDKLERLVIQPHYSWVGKFHRGYNVVVEDGRYGLIDQNGKDVLKPEWQSIIPTRGENYLLKSANGKLGICDYRGRIFLTANFDQLEDLGDGRIIARRGGKVGILGYDGSSIIPFQFDDVEVVRQFLLLKKNPQ